MSLPLDWKSDICQRCHAEHMGRECAVCGIWFLKSRKKLWHGRSFCGFECWTLAGGMASCMPLQPYQCPLCLKIQSHPFANRYCHSVAGSLCSLVCYRKVVEKEDRRREVFEQGGQSVYTQFRLKRVRTKNIQFGLEAAAVSIAQHYVPGAGAAAVSSVPPPTPDFGAQKSPEKPTAVTGPFVEGAWATEPAQLAVSSEQTTGARMMRTRRKKLKAAKKQKQTQSFPSLL